MEIEIIEETRTTKKARIILESNNEIKLFLSIIGLARRGLSQIPTGFTDETKFLNQLEDQVMENIILK